MGLTALPAARGPLVVVVLAQLLAMGLWFAGSAVAPELAAAWGSGAGAAATFGALTVAGFVVGTLVFAVLNVADRFPPQRVMLASALAGAIATALLVPAPGGYAGALALRFATGFALAGVYPVGMKLLASWYPRLGWALGVLVAALTLGSGSPYLVRALGLPWQAVLLISSALAVAGGILVALLVKPGPLLPARSPFEPRAFARAFRVRPFRLSALGYFGHMWELYAFWGLLPLFLAASGRFAPGVIARLTFLAFLAGAIGCLVAGSLSRRVGEARVALAALVVSGACCLLSPLLFVLPYAGVVAFIAVWGAAVIADSAQFSALSAQAAPRAHVGTALTIQNAVGFAVTLASLSLLGAVAAWSGWQWAFLLVAPGPLLGAVATLGLARETPAPHPAAHGLAPSPRP